VVSVVISGLSSPGLSPGQGHYIVFLGKTLNSHLNSLHGHPGVQNWVLANLMLGVILGWTSIPSRGE